MLKDEGKLPDNRVTGTVMSNLGFYKYLEGIGCTVDVTGVGDRYMLEKMLQTGSVIDFKITKNEHDDTPSDTAVFS